MVRLRSLIIWYPTNDISDTTTNGFVQTTDTPLSENIVVNVSIPRSIAEGHEVQLSIITRANSQVDVQTKCIPQPESTVRVPVTPVFTPVNAVHPDISRLNLSDEVNSPIRRDGTVAFNPPSPRKGGPATPRTPITPASARQTARWADAVDVSDDEADGDNYPVVAVYPPPYGELETPHLEQYDGRKYYVITKGRKIGVFYSTWYDHINCQLVWF